MVYYPALREKKMMAKELNNARIENKGKFRKKGHIDAFLIDIIRKINNNDSEWRTIASCCGHGVHKCTIIVRSYITRKAKEYFTGIPLRSKAKMKKYDFNKFFYKSYRHFKFGLLYYLPEVEFSDRGFVICKRAGVNVDTSD